MREITAQQITQAVKRLFLQAVCQPGEDVTAALQSAAKTERSPLCVQALKQLLENARMCKELNRPGCQDTGMAVLFANIGQNVHIVGDFENAVNLGVKMAYADHLRSSVLTPLDRRGTGDNTPAVIHTRLVEGENIELIAAPKGFGSENMSALAMLKPADGVEGVVKFVVQTVKNAGSNPCPPIVAGVGIGGTFEMAALMAKRCLTRRLGQPSDDPQTARLESRLLSEINSLGIGAMGYGGNVTALAVHAMQYPTHIAGLPVAVNICCHAYRHESVTL